MSDAGEIRITMADVRRDQTCRKVLRFFRQEGFDHRRFRREGMTAAELRSFGQHLTRIARLEGYARERLAREAAQDGR